MMRLDRYLCETGFGTRSQVKALLKKGLVQVDGEIVKKAELKIDEERAQVFCGGAAAVYQKYIYLMMNKPPGVLSATGPDALLVMRTMYSLTAPFWAVT